MENIKVQSQIKPENQPSFEEWTKEFKVSSTYNRFETKNVQIRQKSLLDKFVDQNLSL